MATRKLKRGRGKRNVEWIEAHLRVPEGKDVGKPVRLRDWQKGIIRRIYDTPTRRAIVSFGRKNGKTALAAMLLLLHLVGPEAIPRSQLYSAAQSREQAALLFDLAAKMVRMSPDLAEYVHVRDAMKQLACPELGTQYAALSAEASTAYGRSPIFCVHDELGQVRGPKSQLYEALETGAAAHDAPLSIVISTQAPNDTDLLSVLIDDAKEGKDPLTKLFLYSTPIEIEDAFSDEAIREANPAFGDFQNADEVRRSAQDAKRMPAREPEYRNLILNQRVEMRAPFVSKTVWDACGDAPAPLEGLDVYGGLDLSAVSDLTSLTLLGVGERWNVHCKFWLPEQGLREKSRQDREPYDQWAREGFLDTTPGPAIEYEFVAHYLKGVHREHGARLKKLGFDRYNMKFLKPWLIKAGFSEEEIEEIFVEFGQGMVSMSPALRELESGLLNRKVAHGLHPVLRMCARNAVVESDPAGNRKFTKAKSTGRIDGMVALAMAVGVAGTALNEPGFVYDTREMLVL